MKNSFNRRCLCRCQCAQNKQSHSLHHCPGRNSLRYCLLPPISAEPSLCVLHLHGWSWWPCLWRCLKPNKRSNGWIILLLFLFVANIFQQPKFHADLNELITEHPAIISLLNHGALNGGRVIKFIIIPSSSKHSTKLLIFLLAIYFQNFQIFISKSQFLQLPNMPPKWAVEVVIYDSTFAEMQPWYFYQ